MKNSLWIYVFLAIIIEISAECFNYTINGTMGIGVICALLVLVIYYLVLIKQILEKKNA